MLSPLSLRTKEDNIEALTTFSSSPNTATPLHVSTKPQHSKNKPKKIQAQIPCTTYQETFPQHWNEIWLFPQEEPAISHGQCKQHGFQFLSQKKIMREITNPNQMLTTW